MKKLFSLVAACLFVFAANANYYLTGECVGWNAPNTNYEFVAVEGVLTVEVPELYGDIKVTSSAADATGDAAWHPQYGAVTDGDGNAVQLELNTPYVLGGQGGDGEALNLHVKLAENYIYKNAKLTLAVAGEQLTLTLVSATLFDNSAAPVLYSLIGGCTDNWSLSASIDFVEVNGVLTANIPDLNGTFKVIKTQGTKNWDFSYGVSGGGMEVGVPFNVVKWSGDGGNISLANPFAGYKNAVMTIVPNGDNAVLTLVSGEFYALQNNWYIPGTKLGWECGAAQQLLPVEGSENTYQILLAEFGQDFKVVYGVWGVEFGANSAEDKWVVGQHYTMTYPCAGNFFPAEATTYEDVTITIVVDYENAEVDLLIETEAASALEDQLMNSEKVQKIIENGQVVIIRNGERFNVLGAKL